MCIRDSAAAIRDHKRGTIIGCRSYGKGSVQGIFPLHVSGGGVRLTTAKFYSPTGKAINQVGVGADVELHDAAKPSDGTLDLDSDHGLRVSIRTARRELEQRLKVAAPTRTSARQVEQTFSSFAN